MTQFVEYAGRFQSFRGSLLGLPGWARFVLFVFALPGILALALSIVAVLCSLAALLLITVPVYRGLRWIGGTPGAGRWTSPASPAQAAGATGSAGRRHVDVRIIE